jgi:hypothetical protein
MAAKKVRVAMRRPNRLGLLHSGGGREKTRTW